MQYNEERFGHLVGIEVSTKDGSKSYTTTADLIEASVNRLVNNVRKKLSLPKKMIDEEILDNEDYEITDAAILGLIPSIANLASGKNDPMLKKEIKIEEIRESGLGIDKFVGYSEKEKINVQERLEIYKKFYFGDTEVAPNDEWDLIDIIGIEVEIDNLNALIRLNPNKKFEDERKLIGTLRKQRSEALLGLNAKKSQRDNKKKTNYDDEELKKAIDEADKSIGEFESEIDSEDLEEQQYLKAKMERGSLIKNE